MPPDTALALVSFAFATSITPGPNNIMLTASGVNFGFRRTIPHMVGVDLGFMAMLMAVGLGIGMLFAALPRLHVAVQLVGSAYMLWLAWKVATAEPAGEHGDQGLRPMTFLEAAAFQWVNPKAWVIAIGAMAIYVRPDHLAADILLVTAVFGLVTVVAVGTWAGFGHALRNVLRDRTRIRVLNVVMGLLLAASVVPILMTGSATP